MEASKALVARENAGLFPSAQHTQTRAQVAEVLVPLGGKRGGVTRIDAQDYEGVRQYHWCQTRDGYAVRGYRDHGRQHLVYLHREIIGALPGTQVDHINRDKLDNRRCNLRIASGSVNLHNTGPRRDNTSGYRGVSYCRTRHSPRRWKASLVLNGHLYLRAYYATAEEACAAYQAARQACGLCQEDSRGQQ